nr:hypothetical protein [Tanacetum cinerariifolium]
MTTYYSFNILKLETILKLKELIELCTKLSDRVLDLEKIKTAQAKEIADLKKRVKKLERKRRSRTPRMHLFNIGTSRRRRSLGEDDASKLRRNLKQRYKASEGYHAVPPPYTGNFMPPRPDLSFAGLDDFVFKSAISETVTSVHETKTSTSKTSKEKRVNAAVLDIVRIERKIKIRQRELDSTKVKTVNEDVRLQALVDGKKVIVNEASIRRDLRLDYSEGTACLPNAAIFEELVRIGAKTTAWNKFSSTMASAIICRKHKSKRKQRKETEVPRTKPQTEEHMPTPSYDPLPSGEDRMQLSELIEICTKLSDKVLSLEQIKTNQAIKIKKLKKRVKKLKGKKKKRTQGLKRLYKVGLTVRVESYDEEEDCIRSRRMNDEDLFGVNDLDGDEVIVDVTSGENVERDAIVAEKEVSAATDEVVTTVKSIEGITAATTPQISKDDVILAQTLIEIKAAKLRVKGVIVQKPLKNKDQIALDKEVARKLEAQMKAEIEKEEMIAREKDEVNIVVIEEWDDVQPTIDADRQLAEQLQTQEREQLSIKERSKLLAKLIETRRKYFAAERAEEIRNKPPTKAHQKKEDLELLRSMVKERFKKTKPVNDMDNLLFQTFKTMFEHQNMVYYLLVEKMDPFTKNILHQLWNDVRLQVDYKVEMAYDLLRLIRRTMSSPNHPTSNIEDAFSSNFLDFISASPDYVPTSPGKTYSSSSNSFGVVPITLPSISLFHNDPYMKVLQAFYAKELPIPPPNPITPPVILTPSLVLPPSLLFDPRYFFVPEELLPLKKQIHPSSSSSTTLSNSSRKQVRRTGRGYPSSPPMKNLLEPTP